MNTCDHCGEPNANAYLLNMKPAKMFSGVSSNHIPRCDFCDKCAKKLRRTIERFRLKATKETP